MGVREFNKEEVLAIDLEKLMEEKGPRPFLPKRWIVERTGLTPNERTISAYATAVSFIVACSYSDGLR